MTQQVDGASNIHQLIDGFSIRGYRSFHGNAQQVVGPLGKVTVIAGQNNTGKSNVLLAAAAWMPVLQERVNLQLPALETLDRPILSEGSAQPPIEFGIALRCPRNEALESLIAALPTNSAASAQQLRKFSVLQKIADSPGLRYFDENSELIWHLFVASDRNSVSPAPDQIERICQDLDQFDDQNLANVCSKLFGSAGSREHNVSQVMNAWRTAIRVPLVVMVPPVRDIVSEGEPGPDFVDLSGRGLPQLIQTWQAPSAARYREDTKRFELINKFLKDVTEDETAQISVPYNRATLHVSFGGRDPLPLSNLGRGISQVVLMAAIATYYDRRLVCIEEPEVNLHPLLLRKLTSYLVKQTSNQYLLTTHSAHLLDNPDVSVLHVSYDAAQGTRIDAALTRAHRATISQHLGYRASDILQSNAVIWVEGPSDRIYVQKWISLVDSRLVEGVHYSIMFYGGRLLAHLTGEEWTETPEMNMREFISLLSINRNMAIVIDSDKREESSPINSTKTRIIEEFEENGGFAWVTKGREIENYVLAAAMNDALKVVHPGTAPRVIGKPYEDCFASIRSGARAPSTVDKVKSPDKVRVAEEAVKDLSAIWPVLDLSTRVRELTSYLLKANDMATSYADGRSQP